MAISKTLRFEVLRRDGFACTYCGRKPPEVELHIDHVMPGALGGKDSPENLATSCVDCNAGKGSSPPDAEVVAQVSDDARRWAEAMRMAAAEMVAEDDSSQWFVDLWLSVEEAEYLPLDAKQRISRLRGRGLPREVIEEMFWVAVGARHVSRRNRYAYFNGACNRRLEQIQARAAEIVGAEE
jgi:hypothetical protein